MNKNVREWYEYTGKMSKGIRDKYSAEIFWLDTNLELEFVCKSESIYCARVCEFWLVEASDKCCWAILEKQRCIETAR